MATMALARLHEKGWGVEKDPQTVAELMLRAAGQDEDWADPNFQMLMGMEWEAKDAQVAAEWYRSAAKQGDAEGQFRYGAMLLEGRGTEEDEAAGASWVRKAAEGGNAVAQRLLGEMLDRGWAVPQNRAEALQWKEKRR